MLARAGDAEPRTDTRLLVITVAPTPGVVLLAGPADWDSRFLYRTLRDVAQLPVRGFARVDPGRWRSMADLSIGADGHGAPGCAARRSPHRNGTVGSLAEGTTARGVWTWPAGSDSTALPGDWYLSAADASPVAGAFLGQPVDSFPPAIQLTPRQPAPGDWVALSAQLGRRGAQRPAVFGRESGRVRRVDVAVDGLWRWAFRGGSSEQSYRTWVAATASWLLGGADSARGSARPVRPVVSNGRPVVFEWRAPGAPSPLGVAWSGAGAPRADTLRFDGGGHATVWLAPGEYRYRLAGGGGGTVAVEEYSEELRPRPLALTSPRGGGRHPLAAGRPATGSGSLAWWWPACRGNGWREDDWGCARRGVNSPMANDRLTDRKESLWSRIKRVAMTDVGALMRGLNADDLERMERVLIEADFGVPATVELTRALEDEVRKGKLKTEADLRAALETRLTAMLNGRADPGAIARAVPGPTVVLVVGVNGTGKTTTTAKLARRLQREGRKVLLAAADTYRAGAIAQLQIWADRLGVPCVAGEPGGDPASVAFNAIDAAGLAWAWTPSSWTRPAGCTRRKG